MLTRDADGLPLGPHIDLRVAGGTLATTTRAESGASASHGASKASAGSSPPMKVAKSGASTVTR